MQDLTKEIVGDLLNDQTKSAATSETIQTEEKSEETDQKTEVVQEEVVETKPVITEQMVREFGLSNTLVGKPIEQLGKSYSDLQREYTRRTQEISDLKREKEALAKEEKAKPFELGITEEDVELNPDKVVGAMKALADKIKSLENQKQEILDFIGPQLTNANDFATRQQQVLVVNTVQSQLPEGVNATDIMDQWVKENEELMPFFIQNNVFAGKPEKLVKAVIQYYKANQYDEVKSKTKEQVDKEVRDRLKKKAEVKTEVKTTHERTNFQEEKPKGIVGEIVSDLMGK